MNKRILITGGSQGLGKETAMSLAKRDDIETIIISARNEQKLELTKKEITNINPKIKVFAIAGDLSNEKGIKKLIQDIKHAGVNLNVIINNAGTGVKEPLEDTEDSKIVEIFHVNTIAPILITKHFLSDLRENKWGRIINISSISVFKPGPLLAIYSTSKSGLKTLSECITLAEMKNGITCNTIMPGLILTELGKKSVKVSFPEYNEQNSSEIEQKMAENFPAGRFVKPSEVTSVIEFLISDSASGISGEYFRVASGIV